jgi:hypothetical protein
MVRSGLRTHRRRVLTRRPADAVSGRRTGLSLSCMLWGTLLRDGIDLQFKGFLISVWFRYPQKHPFERVDATGRCRMTVQVFPLVLISAIGPSGLAEKSPASSSSLNVPYLI